MFQQDAKQSVKRIFIVTGEPSGDQRAAELITDYQKKMTSQANTPLVQFFGMGGEAMQQAGAQLIFHIEHMAVVGLTEAVKQWSTIYKAMQTVKAWLAQYRPDLIILIDYPGFNLNLADYAKRLHLKTIYYISPQIWAWRPQRIKRMQHSVDHMVVLFPFEVAYYQKAGIPVSLAPHPLVQRVHPAHHDVKALKKHFHLECDAPCITLMPGSRPQELNILAPFFYQAAILLKQNHPRLQVLLPLANATHRDILKTVVPQLFNCQWISIHIQQAYEALAISDAALIVSGTATLEAALLKTPMVIAYRTHWLTYWLAKCLIDRKHIKHIGLCNIVAQKEVAPEYIQKEASAQQLAQAMEYLLKPDRNRNVRQAMAKVREKLTGYPTQNMVDVVIHYLSHNTPFRGL